MGTYSFDKQVGWNRMRGQHTNYEGPALKAIVQAGMNAIGIMEENPEIVIDQLILGSVTFEALSRQKSWNMDVEGVSRTLAEFIIEPHEWYSQAKDELERMANLYSNIENGFIPTRVAVDDNGNDIVLNPTGKNWQCDYCSFRDHCVADGPDALRITESVSIERSGS
jgi:hypothetical protein